jgi:monoamine oxidase
MRTVSTSGVHSSVVQLAPLLLFLSVCFSLSSSEQHQTDGHSCPQENPIIVIGAGLSGVSAAKTLKTAGCPTIILEAKDRIGGRLLSQSFGNTVVDLGGASIHGQGSYLQDFMIESNMTMLNWGSSIYPGMNEAEWIHYQPDGSTKKLYAQEFELSSQIMKTWIHVMGECIGESSNSNDDEDGNNQDPFHACLESSLTQLSTQTGLDMDILNFQIFMEYELDRGLPMDQVDADGFMNDWDWVDLNPPDVGAVKGMQAVVGLMAQGLDIRLNQRVAHIHYSSSQGCTVTTQGGDTYTSAACLVTLPLGVLKQNTVLFDPPLPSWKQEAIDRGGSAIFNSLVLQWNRPICGTTASFMVASPLQGQNPLAHGFVCPGKIRNQNSSFPIDNMDDVTQFYISGDRDAQGNQFDFDDMEYWKQQALQVIQLYAAPTRQGLPVTMDDIVDAHLTAWHLDPDFGGSYSAPVKGTRGDFDREMLTLPLADNTVFFAGEHTNTDGRYQTIDGADDSGYWAARAICRKFGVSEVPLYHADSIPQKEEL